MGERTMRELVQIVRRPVGDEARTLLAANWRALDPSMRVPQQMRALRPILGHAGNLQLTDGEVTLRPVNEVIELLRYARSHSISFRC